MVHVYLGTYPDPRFRDGCEFMPYTEEEMKEIIEMDQSEGRVWNPPPLTSPSLDNLVREIGRAPNVGYQVVSNEVNLSEVNQSAEVSQTSVAAPSEDT